MRGALCVPAPLELLALVQGAGDKSRLNTAGVIKRGFQLAFVQTGQILLRGKAMQATHLGLTTGLVPAAWLSSSVKHRRQSQAGDGLRPHNTGATQTLRIGAVPPFNSQLACRAAQEDNMSYA